MNYPRQDFRKGNDRPAYRDQRPAAEKPKWNMPFKSEWITNEIDRYGIEFTKQFGKYLAENRLTTSQIRNIYGELKRIQMKGFENEKTSFLLLLPKMAYAAQRNKNDGLTELKSVFEGVHKHVSNEKNYKNMMDFMESILAYHKAFGGRDN
jgi:CRISPR-associated protein Csm2